MTFEPASAPGFTYHMPFVHVRDAELTKRQAEDEPRRAAQAMRAGFAEQDGADPNVAIREACAVDNFSSAHKQRGESMGAVRGRSLPKAMGHLGWFMHLMFAHALVLPIGVALRCTREKSCLSFGPPQVPVLVILPPTHPDLA